MKQTFFYLSILIVLSLNSKAQPCDKLPDTKTFSTIIDSENGIQQRNDRGFSGIQDKASGQYLICGDTYAFYSQDVFVNVLDNTGSVIAPMICHRQDHDEGSRWMNETHINTDPLPAGGYFYTGSAGKVPERDLLFKATDKFGNIVSTTIYDPQNVGNEIGHNVIQNNRGGYVAVGERQRQGGQLNAYAVGLDDNFNTLWVNEYFLEGHAWSVVEIPYPISPAFDVVYAVTGMTRDRVFVMLIDGGSGMPIGAPLFTYDLDSNPNTNEVGHSINVDQNGDLIVTGSANRVNSAGVLGNQIFILRIPRSNLMAGSPNLGDLNFLALYDIPNSENEIARDIISNDNNEYIITGRAYSQYNPNNQMEFGRAIMMTVRDNGNVLWINDYFDPGYIGSKGERVVLTDDGGYYMTGSIWNEQIPGANIESYNKFAVKTDQMGILKDCDCCAPNDVIRKDSDWSKEFHQIDIIQDPIPEPTDMVVQEVPIKQEFCDQYCPPEPCDIFTTLTQTDTDTCCVIALDLTNSMTSVYSINVEVVTPGVSFDAGSVNVAFPLQIDAGLTNATNIHLESNPTGNPIPTGFLDDYLTFCYEGLSSTQTIIITYYDQFGNPIPNCLDVYETNCEGDPIGSDCVEVMIDSIRCDSIYENKFKMYFRVYNASASTMGTINFTPLSPVILLPPSHVITPSIAPLATSTTQCIDIVSGGPFPTDIFLTYSMVDTSLTFCCSDQDTLQIELPNCCSPCDDPQEQWVDISQTTTNGDSCCHSLDIFNPCDFTLTKIQTEVITPGVTFSSSSIGGGYGGSWSLTSSPTVADYTPNVIPAPAGNYNDLIEFCLDNPGNVIPQEVAVHYFISDGMGGDSILCSDTLFFECIVEDKCLELVHHTVFCDKETGKYYLDFWVENVSSTFFADKLEVSVAAPFNLQYNVTPPDFYPIVLNPGDTYCGLVEIIGFPPPAAGDYLEIDIQMHKNDPYDCCYEKVNIPVVLPECCEDIAMDDCCDDLAVDKERTQSQGCCFNTELTNYYSSNVSQVLASVLTPDRVFSSVIPNGLYSTSPAPTTFINITHPGQIPFGTTTAYEFCIDNTGPWSPWGYSTLVEYRWIETINNQSVIVCRDTVRYHCGGLIDIPIDIALCPVDILKISDLGDECVDVSIMPDNNNERKAGIVIEVVDETIVIEDLVMRGSNGWSDPIIEDGMAYIDFNGQGPPNDVMSSIMDVCFSGIPDNGLDIRLHWLDIDASGELIRCPRSYSLFPCEPVGELYDQSIPSGTYHFGEYLLTNGVIQASQAVEFKAGEEVQLEGGFEIQSNSTLDISIQHCLNITEN